MIGFLITALVLSVAVATYMYLDWGVLQILGIGFLLTMAHEADEKGPAWRRILWVIFAFSLLVLGHFIIDDTLFYWGALLLSGLLFFISIAMLFNLFNSKPGDGSVLTVYFLGLIILFPVGVWVLYVGLEGLGYW
jgi:hypothetical protein